MKYILLLIPLALSSSLTFESFDGESYSKFLSGFFSGLTNDNVDCKSSAEQFSSSLSSLMTELQKFSSDYMSIMSTMEKIRREVDVLSVSCDMSGLVSTLHKMVGPWGKTIIMKNYVMHSRQITKDLEAMKTCTDNFFSCGQSAGEALRLLTGWTIKMENLSTDNTLEAQKEMMNMVKGLAKNIEWIAPPYCKQFEGLLEKKFSEILEEWNENDDLQDCAMHYSGMALYVIPNVVMNSQNWQNVYEAQSGQINARVNFLMQNCNKDFLTCGEKVAEIVNLLIQYTDEL
jgi:hypothetical protein